ncbi:MAG: TetR/AcrR family transcriptional regulator [Acidimicrobiia bacterium]
MPTTTWERLPAARRQAVLDAAEAEFGAQGFSRGSLNVIARNAGVSKGSLFQYFDDKTDLCAHLADIVCLRIRAGLEEVIPTFPWESDFFEALRRFGSTWVRYYATHPLELALTAAANLELDATSRSAVRVVVNRHYVEVLRPLLEDARRTGQLGADADVDAFLALLMLVLPHLAIAAGNPDLDAVLGLGGGTVADGERAVDRLVTAFQTGFAPRPAPASP